jgi:hypothetical protein
MTALVDAFRSMDAIINLIAPAMADLDFRADKEVIAINDRNEKEHTLRILNRSALDSQILWAEPV